MRAVVILLATMLMVGCVKITAENPLRTDALAQFYAVGEAGGAGKRLIPYTTLDGYMHAAGSGPSKARQILTGVAPRMALIRDPVALGAGDGGVYVIDGETHSLYRFRWQVDDPSHADANHIADSHAGLSHPEFVRLRTLTDLNEPNDLYVAPNGHLFVSDGRSAKVVEYDADGSLVRVYADEENLKRPVGVTVDSRGLRIFVADSLYDRVVVFNPQGRSLYGIGFRGDGPGGFKNIRSMVQGRNGLLYVVNGLRQQIQSYGVDGTFVGSFGQGTFTDAEGIAVDDEDRLFLSDRFNHRLIVYVKGKVAEVYGSHGYKAGDFNQPSRIAFHKGYLFVADRQNSRIQVLRVVPESFLKKGEAS